MTLVHRMPILGILLVLISGGWSGAMAVECASGPNTSPPVVRVPEPAVKTLELVVYRQASLDDALLAAVMEQAVRIWEPYGLAIRWTDGVAAAAPSAGRLRVVIADDGPGGDSSGVARSTIGWIEFVGPGQPRDLVSVSIAAARRLMDATRQFGRPLRSLASGLQDRFLTQALGRSLAHEIGHYLLATADHSATGLMRAQFTPPELLEPSLDAYRLEPEQACRLPNSTG